MEILVVLAIVLLGAAAFVAFGVFFGPSGELGQMDRPAGPRKRRWPRIVGGLLLAVFGCLFVLGSYVSTVHLCDVPPYKEDWWPLESRGNAVAITSSVFEFESGTGGLFCDNERVLEIRARARPTGRKPVFLGAGGVVATRHYLGAGRYEIAATYMSLLDTRRVGDSARRLAPPGSKQSWRSSAVSSADGAGGRARLTHRWRAVGGDPFAFGTPRSERFWLVLMNADGSPGVAADLRFEVGYAPMDKWWGRFGMLVGIGLVVTGIVLAFRRPRSPVAAKDGVDRRAR